ncbi:hypothetical protein J7F01_27100 [Streptomyces sp. ISL-22]|uniref:Lipoprotein n=1 Tax=Streptomyces curacoi TaxID=146536 RepID=A0A117PGN6_9ACTN|nr:MULTISPECIES: hypothetical protein [Streptomyces]KUM79197.1 hypothetical protein AQI70_10155 [Streptomyces curacoi]MBT2416492.1 hypothetical protein [Streptomyces sp. ISL-24]MBT2435771.1 hypothetical protein [Streptomyces sp. ISL-22]
MRAIPAASAALLGVGALVMTAPAAQAHGDTSGFRGSVLPAVIAAGGQVTLRATGCEQSVTVSSAVFDTVTVPRGRTTAGVRVDRDAEPGAVHEVSFYCGTFWQSVDLTVAGGRPVTADHPRRGVHAGEGGSLAGLNLKEIGLGAALVVASLGTAYQLSRQRADEDGDGT